MSLTRPKRNIKKTSFPGNCCGKKCSSLPVCSENKQSTIVLYTTLQWGFNSRKPWLYYLQKHKKICTFMIYNPDFENSTQHLAIYISFIKIIFFVYNKATSTINVLRICYSIYCSCAGMSWYQYMNVNSNSIDN